MNRGMLAQLLQHAKEVRGNTQRILCILVLSNSLHLIAFERLTSQETIQKIPASLGSGAFSIQLPFDEPFLLSTKAAPTLDTLATFYSRYEMFGSGCQFLRRTQGHVTLEPVAEADSGKITALPVWRRINDPQADSVFIPVRRLDPNRVYSFCYRETSSLSDKDLNAFRNDVAGSIDQMLRKFASSHPQNLPEEALDSLQSAIMGALSPRKEFVQVSVPEGSIFRRNTDAKQKLNALIQFARLQSFASERALEVKNMAGASERFRNRLIALGRNPAVVKLVLAHLEVKRDTSAFLALGAGVGTALASLAGNEGKVAAIAEGTASLEPAGSPPAYFLSDLSTVWDAPVIDTRLVMLERTQSGLTAFRFLISRARVDARYKKAGAPTSATLDTLLELTDQAVGNGASVQNRLLGMKKSIEGRNQLITKAVEALVPIAQTEVAVVGTTIGSFEARAKTYVSADAGVVYGFRIQDVAAYFGANFYLHPVNKRVPLRCFCLERRFAFTLGLTATSIKKANQRDDLFGNQSALIGGGFRITDILRITAGTLIFRALDPSPFVDSPKIKGVGFVSTSLDWDAKSALGKVGDLLFR